MSTGTCGFCGELKPLLVVDLNDDWRDAEGNEWGIPAADGPDGSGPACRECWESNWDHARLHASEYWEREDGTRIENPPLIPAPAHVHVFRSIGDGPAGDCACGYTYAESIAHVRAALDEMREADRVTRVLIDLRSQTLASLSHELITFAREYGLPQLSADEYDVETLTDEQREWIANFIRCFDALNS